MAVISAVKPCGERLKNRCATAAYRVNAAAPPVVSIPIQDAARSGTALNENMPSAARRNSFIQLYLLSPRNRASRSTSIPV